MRVWNACKVLALFLLLGLAIIGLRTLIMLLIMGSSLLFAALVLGVAMFTRWHRQPVTAKVRSRETGALFAPGLQERPGRPGRDRNHREENVS